MDRRKGKAMYTFVRYIKYVMCMALIQGRL